MTTREPIPSLLLLGATGDLARRYLLPALGGLYLAGRLAEDFRVIGAAREELDGQRIRSLAAGSLPPHIFTYRSIDVNDRSSLAAAIQATSHPVAVYIALPPALFASTIETIGQVGMPSGSRVAVEKPFGEDLDSARKLNRLLAKTGTDAYRVDHVLGMETVQNLVAMRRANPVLERLWNAENIEEIDILWEETLALEGRAGYYDRAGALKDVLQNHMLQLLALVGMAVPMRDADSATRKLETLESVRLTGDSRRARYTAGRLADGREVGAYADEDGVDPRHGTETFAEVGLFLQTARWEGTRFVLRAGKALRCRRKVVLLRFRGGGELEIGIDGPEDVVLRLTGAGSQALDLRAPVSGEGLPAYARVLLDVLGATSAFSVSGGEAEQAWRIVAPILAAWKAGHVPLEEYAAGSAGPT